MIFVKTRSVACPKCEAPTGSPCTFTYPAWRGQVMGGSSHAERHKHACLLQEQLNRPAVLPDEAPLRFRITSSDLTGYWSKGERRRWYVTGNRPDWDDDLTWGNFPTWQEALTFANARLKEHH
jgi:hypothetical protein